MRGTANAIEKIVNTCPKRKENIIIIIIIIISVDALLLSPSLSEKWKYSIGLKK